ncbi:hypothetical protein SKAU_G00090250 [Synaphobranchus kaupii]|uniref:Uncharacterized protein n=1 Tax=Synaphobranchus kaupii TaxID=118154 RepID=A0A9Q1FWN9_SYNKA|nr:hypothetical protein SKAU_G00090250 [Synaphobranchus kaupii]
MEGWGEVWKDGLPVDRWETCMSAGTRKGRCVDKTCWRRIRKAFSSDSVPVIGSKPPSALLYGLLARSLQSQCAKYPEAARARFCHSVYNSHWLVCRCGRGLDSGFKEKKSVLMFLRSTVYSGQSPLAVTHAPVVGCVFQGVEDMCKCNDFALHE